MPTIPVAEQSLVQYVFVSVCVREGGGEGGDSTQGHKEMAIVIQCVVLCLCYNMHKVL